MTTHNNTHVSGIYQYIIQMRCDYVFLRSKNGNEAKMTMFSNLAVFVCSRMVQIAVPQIDNRDATIIIDVHTILLLYTKTGIIRVVDCHMSLSPKPKLTAILV